ncbi:VanZ family protein [Lentilactobacillus hilgardii]|uniref:VanZ family protein n=1 Tax=Lentilactobacillus hilgardii TaxID=1588 RepID=UPI003FA52D07
MSQYVSVIYTAVILFPFLAILITLPILLVNYHRYGALPKWNIFMLYTFVFYIMCAYFLIILPLPTQSFVNQLKTPTHNFIPFTFIIEFFKYNPFSLFHPGTWLAALKAPTVIQPAFNIFLTVPFGFYLHYYFRRNWKQTFLMSFCLSLFFEVTQYTGLYGIYSRPYRLFDVDDLILNTTGGLLGFWIAGWLGKVLPSRESVQSHTLSHSHSVSAVRRLTALAIDLILISILSSLIALIIQRHDWVETFMAWFILVIILEVFFQRSFGMQLVRIRVTNKFGNQAKWYQVILRNVISYGVIGGTFWADSSLLNLTGTAPLSQLSMIHWGIVVTSLVLLFILVDLLIDSFASRHRLFFEHLSGTDTKAKTDHLFS